MNRLLLVRRSLLGHWRTGAAIALGVAVATAAIIGALVAGDSVTGSLRDRALARLGCIVSAVTAPRSFRWELADATKDAIRNGPPPSPYVVRVAPLIIRQGVAVNAATEVSVPTVQVVGVGRSFSRFFSEGTIPAPRQTAVNVALARDLGVKAGDALLVSVERRGPAAGTLFAQRRRERTVSTMRLDVVAVLPEDGAGSFALDSAIPAPRTVFIDRAWLASSLGEADGADTLVATVPADALTVAVAARASLADRGLAVTSDQVRGLLTVRSGLVMNRAQADSAVQCAVACGGIPQVTGIYLADHLAKASVANGPPPDAGSSYALIAAIGPAPSFTFVAGEGLKAEDDIILNSWLAEDLGAAIGNRLEMTFPVPTLDGSYRTHRTKLTVTGIVAITGPADDPTLVPDIAGITDAATLNRWALPFPVDGRRLTDRDEAYWAKYRATPKAFLHPALLRCLWASGPGGAQADFVGSVRVTPPTGEALDAFAYRYEGALAAALPAAACGLAARPVRDEALAAAQGNADFTQLFLALGAFVVAAAAALSGMLMRLMAERRAGEAGVLIACGWRPRQVAALIAAEGLALGLVGAVLGVGGGLVFARFLVAALGGGWSGAVAGLPLSFHVAPSSLVLGGAAGFAVGAIAVWWGGRVVARRSVLRLLAGWRGARPIEPEVRRSGGGWWRWLLPLILAAGAIMAAALGRIPGEPAFFVAGAALLVAGLAGGGAVLRRAWSWRGTPSLLRLALRQAALDRRRSLLTVGLMAAAAFILASVAAQRRDPARLDLADPASGAGGYALRVITAIPVRYDLGTAEGRLAAGFDADDERILAGATIVPLLVSPGDDISCLNPDRPRRPRLVGLGARFLARGGFNPQASSGWSSLDATGDPVPAFGDAASVRWTLHAAPGDVIGFDLDGRRSELRLAGLLPGSIFAGELLVSEANFRQIFPAEAAPRGFLVATADGRAGPVATVLRRRLAPYGAEVRETREILAGLAGVQNAYLAVFLVLGGFGLLLGTVGMAVLLLRSAADRRSEFALLAAIGFTRRALAWNLALEHAALSFLGLMLGATAALVASAPVLAGPDSRCDWPTLGVVLVAALAVSLAGASVAVGHGVAANSAAYLRTE